MTNVLCEKYNEDVDKNGNTNLKTEESIFGLFCQRKREKSRDCSWVV